MNKQLFRFVNLIVLLMLLMLLFGHNTIKEMDANLTLSCRNELYDNTDEGKSSHYLIANFVLKGTYANVSYRYLTRSGEPHSMISMSGEIVGGTTEQDIYEIAVDSVNTEMYRPKEAQVAHMNYLSNFAKSNLTNLGSHNLTLRLLQRDDNKGFAAVFFQPSNAVCGCRIID
ncbi:hypothetical protein [Ferrimonas aestuarii]|uniref:Uncharacterized protein n=1 Tax=Ferrimonas aestuarii TaxID=2569539 RepID=A0A4U1BTX0_9GAMM|nr:hypothetical protein [Ferrimonas aestuarii]TKB57398.1 hypothetical protein FCL42_03745 [Ferrimonas aestuarii]